MTVVGADNVHSPRFERPPLTRWRRSSSSPKPETMKFGLQVLLPTPGVGRHRGGRERDPSPSLLRRVVAVAVP